MKLWWNVYLCQGLIGRKMRMKLLYLRTRAHNVSDNDRTIVWRWKELPRSKEDSGLNRRPESENYVSERNLLFLVYRSSCWSHSFYPKEWFGNYYVRGKMLPERVIVTVFCILRKRRGNDKDCFHKFSRPTK